MDYLNIPKKAESFVRELFEKNHKQPLLYHNLDHTINVVDRAKEIAAQYELNETDQIVLYTAAWFHDTGHLFVDPAMHEVKSVELMKGFLSGYSIEDENLVVGIENAILATRMIHHPQNLVEQIIRDADTYHLGTKDFKDTNKRIRKEYVLRKLHSPNSNWNKKSLEFMESHEYHTEYCQTLLEEGKQKNIQRLKKKVLDEQVSEIEIPIAETKDDNKTKEDNRKNSLLNKGIQTMLRLTSDNHLELSNMADGKANILISVNAIIISVILSVLLRRLEVDTHLTIPTIIFLMFSLTTIVISILATRPKISAGRFSKEDILNKKTNLLFFGNFHKASLKEYEWGMREMMKDQDYLYGALINDIYHLGVVLGRKYKLIRSAYFVFMVGIIISVLAFALAVLLNRGATANSTAMPL
jgi:HD superfamily phosphodiesterase